MWGCWMWGCWIEVLALSYLMNERLSFSCKNGGIEIMTGVVPVLLFRSRMDRTRPAPHRTFPHGPGAETHISEEPENVCVALSPLPLTMSTVRRTRMRFGIPRVDPRRGVR